MWLALAVAASAATIDDLRTELQRALAALPEPERPYYVALTVTDVETTSVRGERGTLAASRTHRYRTLDVDVRLGTPEVDSTHPLRGLSALENDDRDVVDAPLDDGLGLRRLVAYELDRRLAEASERLVLLEANQRVKVDEETQAPDFSLLPPHQADQPPAPLRIEAEAWATLARDLSARLDRAPHAVDSGVLFEARHTVTTMVDSAGLALVTGRNDSYVHLTAATTAPDGDEIDVYRGYYARLPADLPEPGRLTQAADDVARELEARLAAPRADPYTGPVLLSGRAAAVFVHEVLGHRAEGHRQKRDDEGKTFADLVGQPVLLPTIDIVDDPTVERLAGVDLHGTYRWDDEGTPASRVVLVDDGVFREFLTTRSPIEGFPTSNGHARRNPGRPPLARMGNTLLTARGGLPEDALRARFREELRRQGLPWGFRIDEIDGGFTMTGRVTPNAFNVRASSAWRVFTDGRPDEQVRGIDLVGTPLSAFRSVIATGQTPEVFNGTCGAESGWVPVSAASPALLFSRLETQRKEKGEERPPLLPRPDRTPTPSETR